MARFLIVFGTRSGTTEFISDLIADQLRSAGHEVRAVNALDNPAADADFFVVGSSIIANRWNAESLNWLEDNAETIAGRVALFSVSLTAADETKRVQALALNDKAATIAPPVAAESFAGRFTPQRVNWWRRLLVAVMKNGARDHVDPVAVAGWARQLAKLVNAAG